MIICRNLYVIRKPKMGVRLLNSFLQKNCQSSINKNLLWSLKGKTIVIDANNYLYRFLTHGDLIPNLYEFCHILRFYNINPIFVFDGPPPIEKYELIKERKKTKKNTYEKYILLFDKINNEKQSNNYSNRKKLLELKNNSLVLSHNDILKVKQLLTILNIEYIDATHEADGLCAKLVNDDKAYACLSEDTDMFVYGCSRVIRYLSILNHTCVIYDFKAILLELNMTLEDFQYICILSGTDYNKAVKNIYENYELYKQYKNTNHNDTLCQWLETNDYISNLNITNIKNLFEIENEIYTLQENKNTINKTELNKFLENYNFVM